MAWRRPGVKPLSEPMMVINAYMCRSAPICLGKMRIIYWSLCMINKITISSLLYTTLRCASKNFYHTKRCLTAQFYHGGKRRDYGGWCIKIHTLDEVYLSFLCKIVISLQCAIAVFLVKQFQDDVIKWKHFPRYWPFVRGIHRSPVTSPHKGQWRGTLMFSLICAWINGWVNNREASDLRRHRSNYGVNVMHSSYLILTKQV